ncbi:hypothetical protein [Massilia sp. SYSU DXS3249]
MALAAARCMIPASRRLAACACFMLAAAAPWQACATPPPPPKPCVPLPASVSIDALRAIITGDGDYYRKNCAATDLAARGAPALAVALGLLDSRDADTVHLGFAVLARMGPPARTAIPLLIARSADPAHRYAAFDALGQLGKYDPERVVPHLAAMMERPYDPDMSLDAPLALEALREIGAPARTALPAIRASLERARAEGTLMHVVAAERALAALTPPPAAGRK